MNVAPNSEGEITEWQRQRAEAATEEFLDGLVDVICSMLAKRWWKSQIAAAVYPLLEKAGYGRNHRVLTSLITKAKERFRESAGKSRDEARQEAIQFYEDVIRDEQVDARTKIMAQERLDKLLGLEPKHDRDQDADQMASEIRKALKALEDAYDGAER